MEQKRPRRQTVALSRPPQIIAFANVGGKHEGHGPLREYFDEVSEDSFFGEVTWEKAESAMQKRSLRRALERAELDPEAIDLVFAGDLLNQCIGSSFALREFGIPVYGLYGACSTMGEALGLAALCIDGGFADRCAALTSSHFCTAERQYRMPVPYGSQRTPTAQWTATASGCVILERDARHPALTRETAIPCNADAAQDLHPEAMPEAGDPALQGRQYPGPWITHVVCGRIVDKGIRDVSNMGAAMAPAAYDTLRALFRETGTSPEDYDLILTGDLGELGHGIVRDFFRQDGIDLGERFQDCGMLIYDRERQDMHMGGSGCGCSASVLCGYLLGGIRRGIWKRVIFAPTGALLSPTSSYQGETIPGICHAVCLSGEREAVENRQER